MRDLLAGANAPGIIDEMAAVERRLDGTTFTLLVVGEYKRGKSTLVNALLGKPVLPAGVIPLTSVVTEIAHGDTPAVLVEFADGATLTVPPGRLNEFVTEPGNPANQKGVRRVLVHDPAALLAEGVRIVDTPGVGSIHGHNTRAAYGYLDEADAVVFVMAADQPIGDEERRLLEAVRAVTDKVLFVSNRADLVTADELQATLAFTRERIADACHVPEALIHALSARHALAACVDGHPAPPAFVRFTGRLHRLLVEERGEILLERSRRLLLRVSGLLRLAAQAEDAAGRMEATTLEHVIARFGAGVEEIRARQEEALALLRLGVTRLHRQDLPAIEDRTARDIRKRVWSRVEQALGEAGPLVHVVQHLAEQVGDWVVAQVRDYYAESERLVTSKFAELLAAHEQRVCRAIDEIVSLADDLLGLQACLGVPTTSLSDRPRFYFRAWDAAGGVLPGRAWLLLRLPHVWSERLARRWLSELVDRRIQQNLAAIHGDWVRRLDDALWQLEGSSRRELESAAQFIDAALRQARETQLLAQPDQLARRQRTAVVVQGLGELRETLLAPVEDP
jgi:hypothetical protein